MEAGQNRIEFALRERVRQVRRPLSDEEKSARYNSGRSWTQERIATGELVFAFKTFLGHGLTSEWRDGERPLENQIGEILAVLAVAAPLLEKRRKEAEEAERRRWEEENKRREERERQQQDRNRWRRFIEFAKLWKEAQLAKDFLAALETLSPEPERSFGDRTAAEWLKWARERRDMFDPEHWDLGDLWANIASVTAWDYRDDVGP